MDKFKCDYDGEVVLLADRGYRFIAEQVEGFGLKILIPAIQQEQLNLGDTDSQVLDLKYFNKGFKMGWF